MGSEPSVQRWLYPPCLRLSTLFCALVFAIVSGPIVSLAVDFSCKVIGVLDGDTYGSF